VAGARLARLVTVSRLEVVGEAKKHVSCSLLAPINAILSFV